MAEAAFTPGPWRVDPMYPGDIQSGDGSLELACTAAATLHAGEKPAQEFQLANARLIAAAPELFEALAGMVDGDSATDIDERYENARAALAKARGE